MENIQVLYIHGGETFKNHDDYLMYLKTREITLDKQPSWSGSLAENLGDDFNFARLNMPLKENAQYEDWKINFERYLPFIKDNVILVGFSLGAIFLVQYLSENKFPKKIFAIYLVATPFDGDLPGADLAGGFRLQSDLSLMSENCSRINFLFSKNDDVVPVSHAGKFAEKLPGARITILDHINGHFFIPEFPELIEMIKEDVENSRE
ncbi:MAG: alpha/beta hydrolase [bacterium]|nr:alpha/beta hydrolase [bacterium]